ncbi:DUF7537 family lipoprotein [Halobacterium wangiae]|uniref:DUF7537 family lipoprotein n=1 Tax=Halobacterium wangiae TaxID=2902623 RepID=UPI001E28AA70|nr:hypothetical protein [Halobacterium wangiae]
MRTVLAVVALLVTAGCLGAGAPATDSPEQTPADGFPPGVTADGVENATALLDAHSSVLADPGYTFRVAVASDRTENGSYTGRTKGDEFRLNAEFGRDDGTLAVDTWANDSVVLTRVAHGDETQFDQRERHDGAAEPWTAQLERVLAAGDFEVTDRYVEDGRTVLALDANRTRPTHDGAYQSYRAHAVVDLDGRVHELNTTTEAESESGSWTRALDFELTTVGVDSVERPEWGDSAAATLDASVELDSTDELIELEHQAGEPLPAGTTVELTHDGETHTLTFEESLDVGERAYVAYPADGSAPVLSLEEPSGNFERIEGSYEVSVTGPDGASILNAAFAVETAGAGTTAA